MKRLKAVEDGLWDCSVCTYKNSPEAFKCAMCDVRKGTSTRFLYELVTSAVLY
jgi:hypothetical protein